MRLTAELIRDSLSYLNPLKERELDLRGAFLKRADAALAMSLIYLERERSRIDTKPGRGVHRTPNHGY